ncbi:MAG TPA: chalcone isomerase family protein [Gallionellaceae bacterium]|jgi:hypothetical protein|nr:chalcone isomerase family protein [Gallionellaceae bacterium]HQS76246.1 chalcone isomerase family protein [Gallionellaceae bacterium]
MKMTVPASSLRRIASALLLAGMLPFAALLSNIALANTVPAHIRSEVQHARLAGEGTFRWFGLKIYEAQLWVGEKGYISDSPSGEKFALNLRYARSLYGAKIAEASREEMLKLGLGTEQQRTRWQASMETLFPDVEEGTQLTGIYLPGEGARFYVDGKALGDIRDAEFARAFFAIWLDANTTAQKLRAALLAGAAPQHD